MSNPIASIPISYTPQAEATSATRWGYFWKTAAIITAVALTALTAFVMGWTVFFLEDFNPTMVLITFFSAFLTHQIFSIIWGWGKNYDKQARIASKVTKHWNELTDSKLEEARNKWNIAIPPECKQSFRKTLAEFLYLEKKIETNKEKIEDAKELEATSSEPIELLVNGKTEIIKPSDFTADKINWHNPEHVAIAQALYKSRFKVSAFEYRLALAKTKQAGLLHFMQNPQSKMELSELAKVNLHDNLGVYVCNSLAKKFGDTTADYVLFTQNKRYTIEDLKSKDIQALTNEIFQ